MQTELKREWLRQLLIICSGLTVKEQKFLESLIDDMDDDQTVELYTDIIVKPKMKLLNELIERGLIRQIDEYHFLLLPKYQIIGNDIHGIGFKLSVMLNGDQVVVNKSYDKYKLNNDTVS